MPPDNPSVLGMRHVELTGLHACGVAKMFKHGCEAKIAI